MKGNRYQYNELHKFGLGMRHQSELLERTDTFNAQISCNGTPIFFSSDCALESLD